MLLVQDHLKWSVAGKRMSTFRQKLWKTLLAYKGSLAPLHTFESVRRPFDTGSLLQRNIGNLHTSCCKRTSLLDHSHNLKAPSPKPNSRLKLCKP